MSLAEKWLEIVSGVSAVAPVNLDALIEGGAQQHPRPVPDRFWPDPIFPPPSVRLWQWQDAEYSCIGIRVTEPVAQPRRIALRLASAAVERNVRPIILTPCP